MNLGFDLQCRSCKIGFMEQKITSVKTSPKDFFLYFGVMVGLYATVSFTLSLLFALINSTFPDALEYYGRDYASQIRYSIAGLVVIFPLFVFLTKIFNNYVRAYTDKKDIWIRRWLIYLTLFAAAVSMVIDLVVLIKYFLEGEITIRFILKVFSVLLVTGTVFGYYFYDLRGKWQENKKLSKNIGISASILVFLLLVGGFFVIGSPQKQRLVRFDQQKISDLQSIQYQVTNYWQQKETLPKSLLDLADPLSGFSVPRDPETGGEYTYSIVGEKTFKLCAEFNLESTGFTKNAAIPVPTSPRGMYEFEGAYWQHGIGEVCFERTIDPDAFPPFKSP